jgi:hypothetical protein
VHRPVEQDLLAHQPLGLAQLVVAQRLAVQEVEAQVVGRDERARLLRLRPEDDA